MRPRSWSFRAATHSRAKARASSRVIAPSLPDERLFELGVARFDALHPQELPQLAEEPLEVDGEPEPLGVDLRGTHPGVGGVAVAGADRVRVRRHGPRADVVLDRVHRSAFPFSVSNS